MTFARYAKLERCIQLVEAINNAKTETEHRSAQLIAQGYRLRLDDECISWPCAELDFHFMEIYPTAPLCCGERLDWRPSE